MMQRQTYRIGGELEIGPEQLDAPVSGQEPSLPKPYQQWVDTGRSAIHLALQDVMRRGGQKQAWLPAYCCPSVVAPFIESGIAICFYSMGADLGTPSGLPPSLSAGEIFLFIHYFGFRNEAIVSWLDSVPGRQDAFVLEDCVQASLNSNVGETGDYAFTSYRKFLPQPDGALLASNMPCEHHLAMPDEAFVSGRLIGKLLRGFDRSESFMALFSETEKRLDEALRPASMSWASRYLMDRTDTRKIGKTRRQNWKWLHQRLARADLPGKRLTPLFGEALDEGCVPIGLPVLVHNGLRNDLREYLRSGNIFCPVHWDLGHIAQQQQALLTADRDVGNSILTLPIDQRLGPDELDYFSDSIKTFFLGRPT